MRITFSDFKVWVTWDFNKMTGMYRYGMGEYDVLISDEPRVLKAGEKIAVGCRVKPGNVYTLTLCNETVFVKTSYSSVFLYF